MPFACMALATVIVGGCDLSAAGDAAQGSFDRTLQVTGPVTLHLTNGSGDVKIVPGPENTVRVVGHIRARESGLSRLSATQRVARLEAEPPIRQDDTVIRVGEIEDRALRNNVAIDYEVTVPVRTRVDSRSGSGDQWIGAIEGPVTLAAGSGDVTVGPLAAGLAVTVGSGDVTIHGATGEVTISAGSGDVRGSRIQSRLTVKTASGSVDIDGAPQDAWTIATASGDVDLALPANAAFTLDATSASGGISVTHEMDGGHRPSRRSLSATARGGGARITVSTASGSVSVE